MTTLLGDPQAAGASIQVVVVHQQHAVRAALASLLGGEPDIRVVADAGDAAAGLAAVSQTDADVVVAQVSLPRRSSIELCRDIRALHPRTQVLLLAAFEDDETLHEALLAGAAGYVLKGVKGLGLPGHVRRVARHGGPATTPSERSRQALADVEPA